MNEIRDYEHRVQYYETDQMGVVHHSNYIRWFEEARTYILEEAGFGYSKMEETGIICPVLEVEASYRTMTKYEDVVLIETNVTQYNGVKMVISYTIRDKESGEVRCTGSTKHCFLDRDGKIVRLRKDFPVIHEVLQGLADNGETEKIN